MNRTEKQQTVEALQEDIRRQSALFGFDYRGLKVEEATELRARVRKSGGKYRVVKNTLALRALEGTPFATLKEHFRGMTGLAYTDADPVALAKVLNDFAKDVPALAFKGGMVAGRELEPERFKELASLPGKEELLAKLLYVLQAPLQNLLGVLQAPARDLVLVLKAAADKGQQQ